MTNDSAPDTPVFSFLNKLRALRPTGNASRYSDVTFVISFSDEGEPFISTRGEIPDDKHLSPADLTLIKEMRRIDGGGFDITWGAASGSSYRVSLWKSPHLVNMLRSCTLTVNADGERLTFSDDPVAMILRLDTPVDSSGDKESDNKMENIKPVLVARTPDCDIEHPLIIGPENILAGTNIYTVATIGSNFQVINSLVDTFPKHLIETYLSFFLSYIDNVTPQYCAMEAITSDNPARSVPTIVLEKVATDRALYLRVIDTLPSLQEDRSDLPMTLTRIATVTDSGRIIIRPIEAPDLREDIDYLYGLITSSAPGRQARKDIYRDDNFFIIPAETAGPFLLKHLATVLRRFKLIGSDKLREYKVVAAMPKLNLRLSSGIDFLEGDADVSIGQHNFTIADLLTQFKRNRYVTLADGDRAIIDEKYISRLQRIFNKSDRDGKVKITIFDLPEIENLIHEKITGDFANHTRELYQGFNSLGSEPVGDYHVNATLRPYQIYGIKWIKYLYDNNLGGCLADDMGLGKTLQTISVLSMIYPAEKAPSLIIMPRSLLFNWEKEMARFAPQISVATYYGPGRKLEDVIGSNVIITTYATVRNDIEELKNHNFHYIILDESQNIKNVMSQTSQAVCILKGDHRLALSGTPMENNLTEIYSLFRFLNPAMFGSLDDFNEAYTNPIHHDGNSEALDALRLRIFPFILRRLKKDVLKDLPDRIDQTIYVEMTPRQKALYEEKRNRFREAIHNSIMTEGVNRSQFIMFQALSELRRIASIPETLSDYAISSPKIEELIESLYSSVKNGHKAVVFFNFIAGIEIAGDRLEKLGIKFETMTGSTSAAGRKKIVGRFQTDPSCQVLLMTLKVGGVGLNLTAADTVYIFEPWWNKAAEEQAVNRLHRIGQKATVNAFSVITVDSIEEKIRLLQEQKAELFDKLISADTASSKHLSEADIDFILS